MTEQRTVDVTEQEFRAALADAERQVGIPEAFAGRLASVMLYTPGRTVTVPAVFCGHCNELHDDDEIAPFVGVIGEVVADPYDLFDDFDAIGPPPLFRVREIDCPICGAEDLYAEDGGAVYSHVELSLVSDES